MAEVVTKVDAVEDWLAKAIEMIDCQNIIRVDGHALAGKSTIAEAVSQALGWKHLKVDRFLTKGTGHLRYEKRIAVCDIIEEVAQAQGTVLDGIWLDHLFQPGTLGTEFRIYVRACFAPEYDNDERERRKELGTDKYHRCYDPARTADLVILRLR